MTRTTTSCPDRLQRLLATALIVCAQEHPMSLSRAWCWRELRRLATEDCEYVGEATPYNYRMTCPYREPAIECGPCMAAQMVDGADYEAMLRKGTATRKVGDSVNRERT